MADFTKRFRRDDGAGTNVGGRRGKAAVSDREAPPVRDDRTRQLDPPPVRDERHGGGGATPERESMAGTAASASDVRARQRQEFGGFNWGSAFFGWLVAVGLGALLTAVLAAAGTAIGLTSVGQSDAESNGDTIGIGGGILLLVVAVIAYYAGGYVAGRMSRFDGARQGFGVWTFGLIVTAGIAAAGWILGDEYNVLDQLNLPRIPADAGDLTTGGLIALGAILLGTLVAAIAGGKVGQRFHNRVDRVGVEERV